MEKIPNQKPNTVTGLNYYLYVSIQHILYVLIKHIFQFNTNFYYRQSTVKDKRHEYNMNSQFIMKIITLGSYWERCVLKLYLMLTETI